MPLWYNTAQDAAIKAEEKACVLPMFNSDIAWELGTIIRTRCQQKLTDPVIVYITHAASSQLLFCAASRPGTIPDDMQRVKRMEAVVRRWSMSSLRVQLQMQLHVQYGFGNTPQEALKRNYDVQDLSTYAPYTGGFPVRVKNMEGIVGVIVVSGLDQQNDHSIIVDGIKEYLARERQRAESMTRMQ